MIKSHLLYQLSYAPIHRFTGARNGIRTRDNHLGKVALYQLSYPRIVKTVRSISYTPHHAQGGKLEIVVNLTKDMIHGTFIHKIAKAIQVAHALLA